MTEKIAQKAWLLTATLKNWKIAQDKGLFGIHGNKGALNKIKKGDSYIAFVPRIGFIGHGRIIGEHFESKLQLWPDKMYNHRFQISTPFISGKVVPTASVVDDLVFISDKRHYGVFFREGIREIPLDDLNLVVNKLKKAAPLLTDIVENVEAKISPGQIGDELHDRVVALFENLGFNILDSNYHSPGPDITIIDPEDLKKSRIIIQCKNSRKKERTTFANLDKHLYEYSGRLRSGEANAAIIVVSGQNLPKKVPGESGELSIDQILDKYGVSIWTDETLDYYEELIEKISHFARYQVLSDLGLRLSFSDDIEANAIKVRQNNCSMYAVALRPDWLLKTVSVVRRIRAADGPKGYQRLLTKSRIFKSDKPDSISNYLDSNEKWLFPNAIVLASSRDANLVFKDSKLRLKSRYGQFWVIDGQHRLFAFANAEARKGQNDLLCVVVEATSLGSEREEESELAQIFVTLNGRGKRVPKALLYELYKLLGSNDNPQLEIVLHLAEDEFFSECIRGYSDRGGSINLVAFADAKGLENIYKYFKNLYEKKDKDELVSVSAKYVLEAFEEVSRIFEDEWKDPDQYFLKTDRGVRGLLELFYSILNKYGQKIEHVTRVLEALKRADFDFSSETAKGMYLGAGGPDRLARTFSKHINRTITDFDPKGSPRTALIPSQLSERGEVPDALLREWIGKLEGEVRCLMNIIDTSTAKYLSYLDINKVRRVRMFFGNCYNNDAKVKDSIQKLRNKGLNIILTQSQKRTAQRGSFFHARWIGDEKIQIRTEVDLKDDSLKGSTFHVSVDSWTEPAELDDFERYWSAAEMNKDVEFGYDWGNSTN